MATSKGKPRKAAAKLKKPAARKPAAKTAKAVKLPKAIKATGAAKAPGASKGAKAGKAAPRREAGPARSAPPAAPEPPAAATAPALISEPEPEAEAPAPEPAEEEEESGEVVAFEGVLTPNQPAGTFIPLTREQSERFPGAGLVRVKGTVGGVAIQSSLMPVGDGTRCLGVHKATMEQGGFHVGDTVKVAIRLDTSPREVVVPKDFLEALEKSPAARRTFANYAFSHRKEYVNWIEEARQPETRQRRIDQAVRMIEAGEKLS